MNEIKQVIASTFQIPVESISAESSSQDIPQWDSVGHINLVMGLEKQFGVKFNMNEILEMRDVSTIERILQEKK
jgi:acyl carrier protein